MNDVAPRHATSMFDDQVSVVRKSKLVPKMLEEVVTVQVELIAECHSILK